MTMRRMLVMAGGAVLPLALLSIVAGNQWVVDAVNGTGLRYDEGLGPVIGWLLHLRWRLTAGAAGWEYVIAADLSTVLFFVVLMLCVAAGARSVDPERGGLGALVTGWWATVVAGGLSGLVLAVLLNLLLDIPGGAGPNVLTAFGAGAAFGLALGWTAGLGAAIGFLVSRPRGQAAPQQYGTPQYGAQQYGTQQYGAQQPGTGQPGMGQPYPYGAQPPQQGRQPYVPPQAQSPQQGWGGAPAPRPGAGPPGAPYVPPQAQAPQAERSAAGPGPAAPEQAPPEQGAERAEPERAESAAPDEPGRAAGNAQDDDLDLADRTVIDRNRDEET